MVFLLGKSGSGKSTLLNLLGGLDKYDEGEIIIKGVSSKDFKQSHFDSYRNTYVGFIFQEYNVLEEFSVGANIALAIELQGKKATDEEINRILKQVDLEDVYKRQVFDDYGPFKGEIQYRKQGSLIAFEAGEAITYGLFNEMCIRDRCEIGAIALWTHQMGKRYNNRFK